MKKELYLMMIAVLGIIGVSIGQAQNPECMTNLSIYAEHAKVKNYDAAYGPWKMVYTNCPDINKANFSYGERILSDKIDKSTWSRKRCLYKRTMTLYDDSGKYFLKVIFR